MEYIRFGHTGLHVSKFCLGTMGMGSSAWKGWVLDEEQTIPILKKALDRGINFVDMADWYSLGRNEEVVGQNLLKMTARENLVLVTKAFYPMSADPNDKGLGRKHLLHSIDRSLKRIGTDYVDLYIIHAFDSNTEIEETMETLDTIIRAGKVRYIGASTMYAWQFAKMNYIARLHGWSEFVNMQCQYSLLYREEEREMMPFCQSERIAVSTFSPLARGFLTGVKQSARVTYDIYMNFFGDEIDVAITERVAQLAHRRGVSPSHIAMAWVAQNVNVTTPIIGADSPEQLDIALEGAALILSDEEVAYLEELYRPRDMINDYNNVRRPRALEKGITI